MLNYIDIIIIIYVGFTCIQGYRKGFIKTLFDTLGVVISFFLSKELCYITEEFLINNTKLYNKVHELFESEISTKIIESFDKSVNIPVQLKNIFNNIISTSNVAQVDTFALFVDNISIILIRSISFIITFLVLYALLVLISNFINAIFKLPLLNLTNRVFGAGTGLLKSVIVLYIIFALSTPIVGLVEEKGIVKSVLSSESSEIFYDNNIILNYLSYKGFFNN